MIRFTLILFACLLSSNAFAAHCDGNTVKVTIVDPDGVESVVCMAPAAALRVADCPCGRPAIVRVHGHNGKVTKELICEDENSVSAGSLLRLSLGVYRPPRRCGEPVHIHPEAPLPRSNPTVGNDRNDYAAMQDRFSVWEDHEAEKAAQTAKVERAQRELRDEATRAKAELAQARAEIAARDAMLAKAATALKEERAKNEEGGE
jgi:hypothetical protein